VLAEEVDPNKRKRPLELPPPDFRGETVGVKKAG
jgi:hypothetical protein